jgi:hypothetical protein
MGKLRLSIEDLRVDSFATDVRAEGRAGTVQAHAKSAPLATCAGDTCNQATCVVTECDMSACIASCGDTCQISCGACMSVYIC